MPIKGRKKRVWIWVLASTLFLLAASILIPGLLSSYRASNERAASSALKEIARANAEFKALDLDKNGVQDHWTGDVAGLCKYVPSLDKAIGQADALPLENPRVLPVFWTV